MCVYVYIIYIYIYIIYILYIYIYIYIYIEIQATSKPNCQIKLAPAAPAKSKPKSLQSHKGGHREAATLHKNITEIVASIVVLRKLGINKNVGHLIVLIYLITGIYTNMWDMWDIRVYTLYNQ